MLVSIICPNHGRDLTELIESVENSTYKDVELIIVDEGEERSVQRNRGIDRAKGDAFLILDSDQSISLHLIAECVFNIQHGYSCCYIPELIVADSFFGKIRSFERMFYTGTAIDVPRFVLKCYCPKFNTDLNGPEDADWGNRIKGQRCTTDAVLYHNDDIGFWDYCKKKAYYTRSMRRYKDLNPDDKCLNIWYRCVTVFTERGKWKELFIHPILTIGVLFILIIRGAIYYAKR